MILLTIIILAVLIGHAVLSLYWRHQWTRLRIKAATEKLAALPQEIHDQNYADEVLREAVEAVYGTPPQSERPA